MLCSGSSSRCPLSTPRCSSTSTACGSSRPQHGKQIFQKVSPAPGRSTLSGTRSPRGEACSSGRLRRGKEHCHPAVSRFCDVQERGALTDGRIAEVGTHKERWQRAENTHPCGERGRPWPSDRAAANHASSHAASSSHAEQAAGRISARCLFQRLRLFLKVSIMQLFDLK